MNINRTLPTSYLHTLLHLLLAAFIVASLLAGAAAVGELAGVDLVTSAYACQAPAGGC